MRIRLKKKILVILAIAIIYSTMIMRGYLYWKYIDNSRVLDILDDLKPPKDAIFFIDSTEVYGAEEIKEVTMTPQAICAVESTAKLHPTRTIYVLFTTPISPPNSADNLINVIYNLKNVVIRTLDPLRFVEGTPLTNIFQHNMYEISPEYPSGLINHILRVALLWRFGGTYLDLDFIVMKNFNELGKNFVVVDPSYIDCVDDAVMSIENRRVGLEIIEKYMSEIILNINDTSVYIGWELLTKVIENTCYADDAVMRLNEPMQCKGFWIFPTWAFYPFDRKQIVWIFNSSYNPSEGFDKIKDIYAIHTYGRYYDNDSYECLVGNETDNFYSYIARRYCPDCYKNVRSSLRKFSPQK